MTITQSRALALGRKGETDLLVLDLHEVADYWSAIMLDIEGITLIDLHRLDRLGSTLVKASYLLDLYGSQYRALAIKSGDIPKLSDPLHPSSHISRGGMLKKGILV